MDLLQIWSEYANLVTSSAYFHLMRSISAAYVVKRSGSPSDTFFKRTVAVVFLSFGGNILSNLILGNPNILLFNAVLLPICVGSVFVVENTPIYELMEYSDAMVMRVKHIFACFSSGSSIVSCLMAYRDMKQYAMGGRESVLAQYVLATVAGAGGGLLYSWFIMGRYYRLDGWFFQSISFVSAWMVIFLYITESERDELAFMKKGIVGLVGTVELKFLAGVSIFLLGLIEPMIEINRKSRLNSLKSKSQNHPTDAFEKNPIKEQEQVPKKDSISSKSPKPTPVSQESPKTPTTRRRSARFRNKS